LVDMVVLFIFLSVQPRWELSLTVFTYLSVRCGLSCVVDTCEADP